MVNEFLGQSPKRQDDSNDEDSYREPCVGEKVHLSESSDEDTTSSSLLPIPDTLDEMRKELKTTINNICGTGEFSTSPKRNDFNLSILDAKRPSERELSIAQKISSANILLDDLISCSNMLPSQKPKERPLVFNVSTTRRRGKNPSPEVSTSDPTTETTSSSSGECCHGMTVTPFIIPTQGSECPRCSCERKEATVHPPVVTEQPPRVVNQGDQDGKPIPVVMFQKKKPAKRHFLPEKFFLLRRKWSRKKMKKSVDREQQTQGGSIRDINVQPLDGRQGIPQMPSGVCLQHPPSLGVQSFAHLCGHSQKDWKGSKCVCPEEPPSRPPTPEPECSCPRRHSHREKPVEEESLEEKELRCEHPAPSEPPKFPSETADRENCQSSKEEAPVPPMQVPLIPLPVRSTKGRERIDIYYFDHGNSAYYRTTDNHPAKFTEYIIERTDEYATKFWAEIFGTVTIAIAFVISFILQLYRCLFTAIIRSLMVGLIQIFSDYFVKPLLTVIFNGLIQPFLILGYNIATSVRDFCVPVCEIFEFCAKDLAIIFRSCRVVEINQRTCSSPSCHCRHV